MGNSGGGYKSAGRMKLCPPPFIHLMTIEVLMAPAEFAALDQRELRNTTCVVFDVLRATSSMVTALAHGAAGIAPVSTIAEALAMRRRRPRALLAGERNGLRIGAELTGGAPFDFGNSPREFVQPGISRRVIIMTTTNGTRALRACAGANRVLIASFLNLASTARAVLNEQPVHLLLVCSGTHDQVAQEDVLAAGAFYDLLWRVSDTAMASDSALMARMLYLKEKRNLRTALRRTRNGRRLDSQPELRADVAFCAERDTVSLVAALGRDGVVRTIRHRRASGSRKPFSPRT